MAESQLDLIIKLQTENVQALTKLTTELEKTNKAFEKTAEESKKGSESAKIFGVEFKKAGVAAAELAGAFAPTVAAISGFIALTSQLAAATADLQEKVNNAAAASGAEAELLVTLGTAAEEAGLGGIETANNALIRLFKLQQEASEGNEQAIATLEKLAGKGVDLENVNVAFRQIVANVNATGGAAGKASDLIAAFGRGGAASCRTRSRRLVSRKAVCYARSRGH